jgi:hypothetical protein
VVESARRTKLIGTIALVALLVGAVGAVWLRTPKAPQHASPGAPALSAAEPAPTAEELEELRLITGAEAALRGGDTDRVFSLLYEHATRFPKGKLTATREMMHIRTLCKAGKAADAREEAATFAANNPGSALLEDLKGTCANQL